MRVKLSNAFEEEGVMSKDLLTIIGNAAVDNYFLEQLFKEPLETITKYGFQLTDDERQGLEELTRGEYKTENQQNLRELYVCPHKPCLLLMLTRPKGFGPPPEEKVA
jgi:hypothetical protein